MMEWNDAALACCGVFLPREEDRKMLCSILREETEARVRSLTSRGERLSRDQVFLQLAQEVKKLRRRAAEIIYPGEAQLRIEELDLSLRSYNCLRRAGIYTVGDLLSHTPEEIDRIRNLGKKSQAEIRDRLAAYAVSCTERPAEHSAAENWRRKAP